MHQKLVPESLLILVNNPNSHCIQEILLKVKIFWKRIIKNPFKSQLYFFSKASLF